ncbi:MAG TPA: glycosyltransferase, partial [Isosphaeraceae bacterium]|nr:glycosyltransferase [Isosphaeraceae bacterium]
QGVPVRPFCSWTDSLASARLLHLFGMSREGLELARVARDRGIPVVLSPICWYEPRSMAALASSRWRAATDLAVYGARRAWPRIPGWRRSLLRLADRILPNSQAEACQLYQLFSVEARRVRVVPNGVDPRFLDADPELFRSRVGLDDFVLYTGRIEPRKNVLGLIRAVGRAGLPLVVIGDPVPGQGAYLRACEEAGWGVWTRVPRLSHDDPLLASAYASARVFSLVSWFETPGLSALEAAVAGSAVVMTPYGCTREYFADHVNYARPGNPDEIASAIERAWKTGGSERLRERILARYLWSHVSRMTLEVYDELAP